MENILDDKEKKIFICHGITKEAIKNALNSAIVPISFIKGNIQCNKFTDEIVKADYLIIDGVLTIDTINKLNGGKMKELVHGEYSKKGELLPAKKLIIICDSKEFESIFPLESGLRMRCKFIL